MDERERERDDELQSVHSESSMQGESQRGSRRRRRRRESVESGQSTPALTTPQTEHPPSFPPPNPGPPTAAALAEQQPQLQAQPPAAGHLERPPSADTDAGSNAGDTGAPGSRRRRRRSSAQVETPGGDNGPPPPTGGQAGAVAAGEGGDGLDVPPARKSIHDTMSPSQKRTFSKLGLKTFGTDLPTEQSYAVEDEDVINENAVATTSFIPQPQSRRTGAVYVESTRTGKFTRLASGQSLDGEVVHPDYYIEASGESFKTIVERTSTFLGAFFVFCHGLLGGYSTFHFLLVYSIDDGTTYRFLKHYSPVASSAQQIYFALGIISVVSSFDKYLKDRMAVWHGRGGKLWVLDICVIVCHMLAFLLTIAASKTDDIIHYSYLRMPEWYEILPDTSNFKDTINEWHAINTVRFVCCFVGWALLSLETRFYYFSQSNREIFQNIEQVMELQQAPQSPGRQNMPLPPIRE
eukprot:GFYU01007042.1.p1 GENE.GFYU01007042.1~~GFYU01007042.1.p1  ORF type:complete len:465 (-),score=54.55 GFYU01007042.1:169-1563(-)